jgi:hypothetical protein
MAEPERAAMELPLIHLGVLQQELVKMYQALFIMLAVAVDMLV